MNQYRFFKWDEGDLIFLGEEITERDLEPNEEYPFPDANDQDRTWEISEVLKPNPSVIRKPNGTKYHPDPIVIFRPKK